jgi:hypothetical protein
MRILGDNLSTFTHWFGWTVALIASCFFIAFDFAEWVPLAMKGQSLTYGWFYGALLIAVAGMVLSFLKRTPGGLMMLAGGLGMVAFFYLQDGWKESNMMIVYGLPFILPAFLLLLVKKQA